MQYAIPQFIDVEDKVIGPLTVRQFMYLIAGVVLMVFWWSIADLTLFIFLSVITVGIAGTMAFLKINGRPIPAYAASVLQFFTKPRLRVWFKDPTVKNIAISNRFKHQIAVGEGDVKQEVTKGKLEELSNILDLQPEYYGQPGPGTTESNPGGSQEASSQAGPEVKSVG